MVGVGIASLLEMMMVEDKNVNFDQTRVDICLSWSFQGTSTIDRSRINPFSEKGHQLCK